jgi:hypothetical protein
MDDLHAESQIAHSAIEEKIFGVLISYQDGRKGCAVIADKASKQ